MKELRLMRDDWVQNNKGEYGQFVRESAAPNSLIIQRGYAGNWFPAKWEGISGIPLTEKILVEWFTARESGGCYLMDRPDWGHYHIEFEGKEWRICYGVTVICSGEFVHELQRAFELFEGEPLTRKEQNE